MNWKRGLHLAIAGGALWLPQILRADDKPAEKTPEQLFQEYDRNNDGKLSADEFPDDKQTIFERLLREGDKDKSGTLTKDEFLEAVKPEERRPAPPAGDGARPQGLPDFNPRQFFNRLDRNRDGKLSVDELPEGPARNRFKPLFDRLGKKELSLEEFTRAAERNRPDGARRGTPEERFKQFDRNGDGKLTLDEAPEPFRPRLERMLAAAGKGKNSALTVEEFVKLSGPPAGGEGAAEMPGRDGPAGLFRLLDRDGDGKLSKEELQRTVELVDELDADKDGALDLRELSVPPRRPGAGGDPLPKTTTQLDPPAAPANAPLKYDADLPAKPAVDAAPPRLAATPTDPLAAPERIRKTILGGRPKPEPRPLAQENAPRGITRAEATGKLREHFDEIDANKNGILERPELERARTDIRKLRERAAEKKKAAKADPPSA
jgi:Ca2+-binding EF-hand superfamily protein